MKKNNQEIGDPFLLAPTPFFKRIIDSVKAKCQKLFTAKDFLKFIIFSICFYFAVKITNFWTPLRDFLVDHGGTALKALIVYYLLYPLVSLSIYISIFVFTTSAKIVSTYISRVIRK